MRNTALIVFRKELLEVIRDRRTLLFMIVMPLLAVPLLLQIVTTIIIEVNQEAASATLDYAVFGGEHRPELEPALEQAAGFAFVELADPSQIVDAVADDRIDFALVVHPSVGMTQQVIELYYNNASSSSTVVPRTQVVFDSLQAELQRTRFNEVGIEALSIQLALIEPVAVVSRGTASQRELVGERVGGMLPYLFVIACLMGVIYPAIDLTAGEKERGTLETLLLAPIGRQQVVIGKFLVVFASGVTVALLTLVGLGGWLMVQAAKLGGDLGAVLRSIGVVDLSLIAAMLIPTAAVFAAVALAICVYAKSFKEAQSYLAPLNIAAIMPAAVAMLPGVELNWKTSLIPIANISLAIKELVKGTMDYSTLAVILGSSTALAALLLGLSTWWFNRESVLFRY